MEALEVIKAYEILRSHGLCGSKSEGLNLLSFLQGGNGNDPSTGAIVKDSEKIGGLAVQLGRATEQQRLQPGIANILEPHEGIFGNIANPIRVSPHEGQHGVSRNEEKEQRLDHSRHSFRDALLGKDEHLRKPITKARREGGNIVVDLDVEDYRRGVEELIYSVVGCLSIQKDS